jgi:desulfoferrodoxin (superoxide reductase-like protein)
VGARLLPLFLVVGACTTELPPLGSKENPFSLEDPGPHGAVAAVHQPVAWGARTALNQVRLWLEVVDPETGAPHPQDADHRVAILGAREEELAEPIVERAFLEGSAARVVVDVTFSDDAETITSLAECTVHGWWRRSTKRADLDVAPVGDATRPFSAAAHGDHDDAVVASHVPRMAGAPGGYVVEVGDRAEGAPYASTPEHYVDRLRILNEQSQTLVDVERGPDDGDPVFPVDVAAGTGLVRILASCTTHGWWETEYVVPE